MGSIVHGRRRRWAALGAALVVLAGACAAPPRGPVQVPDDPPPAPGTPLLPAHLDCSPWRYDDVAPGPVPAEWDPDDDRFGSWRDPGSARSPHRLCGQQGAAVDLAWGITQGRPDVVIAVLDSGIEWRDPEAMADLAARAHLNDAEVTSVLGPVPDADGDGRLSVPDLAGDARIGDRNGNGLADPEDLILTPALNDGVDADGNGWVDDISGWDLLHDDNNPLDDVDYGHGTGEAQWSVGAADGAGRVGTCPQCVHLQVRVGDSFIADGGRFAAGVLFALDSGADVVQEALGVINNPPQAQAAVDAAYRAGVPVVASMADEQSQHPNLPAALARTIPVNSLTSAAGFLGDTAEGLAGRRDPLALNGCTNSGGIAWVAVPSDACSSEATGNAAGMVGLVQAAARDAGVAPHPDLAAAGRVGPGHNVLSAEEVAQLLRAGADDVDFATPNVVDPPNETFDDQGTRRFPTVRGWDATTGHGQVNAYESVRAAAAAQIPPEADLWTPTWFATLPTAGTLRVDGRVAAVRSAGYGYRVEWTTGLQTPAWPAADEWRVAAEVGGLAAPVEGPLATIDLAAVAAALPGGGTGTPSTATGLPDPDRFTVRIRVVVTDAEGRVGTVHRHVQVHDDPDRLAVPPVPGAGASSPVFADLDGDSAEEVVVATDHGRVHALRPDGSELPGWPARTGRAPFWPDASPAATAAGIDAPDAAVAIGAPAVGDLDGDGADEVVVADLEGVVHVFDRSGATTATMAVEPRFSDQTRTDERNRVKRGFLGGAALGDLDGDGDLEVVGAALDRHVYAWHHDGTPVAGFPVLVVDPAQAAAVDPDSHRVTFADPERTGQGGELVATPALGDLDGDGRPEIVVGAQEQYDEPIAVFPPIGLGGTSGNTRLYAISPDGTTAAGAERSAAHPDETAYLPGWPVPLPMVLTGVLPTIGNGVATQAAIGDVDGNGTNEVVATSVSGQTMVFDADGATRYGRPFGLPVALNWLGAVPLGTNSDDVGALLSAFGGPALGRLGSPVGLDVTAPTTGPGRALDTLFANDQVGDPQLTAWSGVDGAVRPGFPRVTADIAFFVTPAIADVDGDGANESVAGHGVQTLDAVSGDGTVPAGWPKLTGGWVVGTPGFGDWDGDGRAEVAITRRDGSLLVWRTPTPADAIGDWVRFGGNPRNTGTPLLTGP